MNMGALKIFCDVVRHHSFSRGAQENRVTQSSASQTIQQLEARLGVVLVDRSRRPWKLTAEGRVFFEGCVEILERYGRLEQEIQRRQAEFHAQVRVAAIYSVGLGPMKEFVRRFTEQHPEARVQVEYLHPDRVYDRVLEDAADLGIVSFPSARRELAVIPWRDEEMLLVCPPTHRLARMRAVPLAELRGEPFVAFDRGLVIRRQVDRFLKRRGVEASVAVEFDNVEAIKRAVEVGTGISILPRPTLDQELSMGTLKAAPFAGARLTRPLGLVHRKGKRFSPGVEQFIQLLRREERPAGRGGRPARQAAKAR
jgi:DNA-binding transcriptional LysR family regulator